MKPQLVVEGPPSAAPSTDGGGSISIPIRLVRRSGRRLPRTEHMDPRAEPRTATPLQLALARGHRWLGMIERGEVASMSEIARQTGGDPSYIARMINLTTLAPGIVEAILDEALPDETRLVDMAISPPHAWCEQYELLRSMIR
ncbi:LacI family transcriptional regulator [Tahibacter amnicola]|uniref:LacI family transcriptional regulator n=1 Tax=Tahibacter amnicola TaxID=2976241 RepID=A0ABY6BFZ7_9GAMM|nr:LacI family transcriptional regulator [Tahibacter amnicola]UXI68948.1 LacI family transcriptional regulator [Tahibacter amnicola]